jgi:hypothetical protein
MFRAFLTVLLQLWLLAAANAAPTAAVTTNPHFHAWHYGLGGGVFGFLVLVLDIIVFSKLRPRGGCRRVTNMAAVEVLQSNRSVLGKVLWCLLVFLFPIGGMIIYWLFSNRRAHARGYETIT